LGAITPDGAATVTAGIDLERLLQVFGTAYGPRNALRKTLVKLTRMLAAERASLVVFRGGSCRTLHGNRQELTPEEAAECWRLASFRGSRAGARLLIPLPIRGADRLTGDPIKGVLVLSKLDDADATDAALEQKLDEQTIRTLIGEHLSNLLDRHDADAYRAALQRLVSAEDQLAQSRDVAYKVARETRMATSYDGGCVTLSWSAQFKALQSLAVLEPADSSGEADARRPRPFMEWTAQSSLSELASLRGRALLASEEEGGALSLAVIDAEPGHLGTEADVAAPIAGALNDLLRLLDTHRLAPGRTKLVIPILSGASCIGVQVVSTMAPNGLTERDVAVSTRFASFCVPPLMRDEQLVKELEYLDKTAKFRPQLPTAESQLKAVLSLLCERIRRRQDADQVVIAPFNYRKRKLIAGAAAVGTDNLPSADLEPAPGGVVEHLLDEEDGAMECHLLPGEDGVERWHRRVGDGEDDLEPVDFKLSAESFLSREGTRSFYAKVLRQKKEIPRAEAFEYPVGFLFVDYSRPRGQARKPEQGPPRFSRSDKGWIEYYARVVADYLATHQEVAARYRIDRRIRDVYNQLSQHEMDTSNPETSVEALIEEILEVAIRLVEGTAGVLAVPCGEHHDLEVISSVGLRSEESREHIAYGEGVTGHCGEKLKPVVIPDSADPSTWPTGVTPLPWVKGSRSEIAVPVRGGAGANRLIGVLNIDSQVTEGAFGEEEVKTLSQLGQASALALNLAGRLEQLRSLRNVGESIDQASQAEGVEPPFKALLDEAMRVTGAYAASVRIIDPSGTRLEPVLHLGVEGDLANQPTSTSSGVPGWVYSKQRTCVIDDFRNRAAIEEEYGDDLDPVRSRPDALSELCVPITWNADRIGVLNLEHVHEFGLAAHRSYAEALASQAAFVLAQRRQHSRILQSHDEKLVDGVTQFAAAIAHEVQWEFTNILHKTEAVEPDSEAAALARDIGEKAARGRAETVRLIQFGANPLAPMVDVDIPDLLGEIVREHADGSACEMEPLQVSCEREGLVVRCKPNLVTWCVRTLINNSIAHNGGRRPKMQISVDCPTPEWLGITVADDGPGVTPELMHSLFEWDWTATRINARHGLPLLHSFVETMGGHVVAGHLEEKRSLAVRISLPREQGVKW
jgi:GAF domain-containing protein